MKKTLLSLLLLSSVAQSSELDSLLESSTAIVDQINTGILLVGAASEYAYQGDALSDGTLSTTAHIQEAQVQAYNNALVNFADNYKPYGDIKAVLETKAMEELELMDEAIGTFTEAVVNMIEVQQVAEKVQEAEGNPQQEEEVQIFVAETVEVLQIEQEDVDAYNQSTDDIETHANNASAYLAVANSEEAVAFLEQGIENANTTAEQTTIFYDANAQWVSMGYNTTRNLTAVFLNGNDNMGLDLYVTETDILAAGSESEFFQTSPTHLGYSCFMYGTECVEL
jgi:tetratricopeptide (TPR) repeat protein